MPQPILTSRQLETLRFLADRYLSAGRMAERVRAQEIPRADSESEGDVKTRLSFFQRMGWVEWATNESVNVKPAAVDYIHQLDNPEPKNYLTEWTVWWFSSRWRAVVSIITIVLPLLVKWIEMIKTVLRWTGLTPDS